MVHTLCYVCSIDWVCRGTLLSGTGSNLPESEWKREKQVNHWGWSFLRFISLSPLNCHYLPVFCFLSKQKENLKLQSLAPGKWSMFSENSVTNLRKPILRMFTGPLQTAQTNNSGVEYPNRSCLFRFAPEQKNVNFTDFERPECLDHFWSTNRTLRKICLLTIFAQALAKHFLREAPFHPWVHENPFPSSPFRKIVDISAMWQVPLLIGSLKIWFLRFPKTILLETD